MRELARVAHDRGVLALSGRAVAAQHGTPYRLLAEALVAACRRSGPPESAELVPYRPALGRLIPEWHRSQLAPSAESTVVLGEAVLRMLRVLGRGAGVLLTIEDVHWADRRAAALPPRGR
jgi:hypothetical protein